MVGLGIVSTYMFLGERALKLVQDGVNITNSTNPLVLTKNITLMVIDCCLLSLVRLAAHCIAAGATIPIACMGPNPVTVGAAIHLVTKI